MANQTDEELDLGVEQGPKRKKLFLILAIVGVVILGGGVAAFFLLGSDSGDPEIVTEPQVDERPLVYHALSPEFVVNLPGKPRLLQIGITVQFREPDLAEFLEHNDPMVRNNLLTLLSAQEGAALRSRAGKEKLKHALLTELEQVRASLDGPGEINDLFFTSFVMQ